MEHLPATEMATSLVSDEELAERATAGDQQAFGVLAERYSEKLKRYGRKFLRDPEDIEDLIQDVFIRAYQNLKSFDTKLRFSPWLYRIAHNAFVNELRKKSRAPFFAIDFDTLVSHPVAEEDSQRDAERREAKELADAGLGELAPKYREVLLLYYEEGLSYKEIADVLLVPVGTVSVRLKRAKEALVQVYARMNITYEF